jgi:hypothetical protein
MTAALEMVLAEHSAQLAPLFRDLRVIGRLPDVTLRKRAERPVVIVDHAPQRHHLSTPFGELTPAQA